MLSAHFAGFNFEIYLPARNGRNYCDEKDEKQLHCLKQSHAQMRFSSPKGPAF